MYPAISDSGLLFHVALTGAALSTDAVQIKNAIVATARRAHRIRPVTSEWQRDAFIMISVNHSNQTEKTPPALTLASV